MNNKDNKRKFKEKLLLSIGLFFLFGAIVMITEDISATLTFGIISTICIWCSKDLIKEEAYNKQIKKQLLQKRYIIEAQEEVEQIKELYNIELTKKELELEHQKKLIKIEEEKKKLEIVQPTETEIKVTITKIEELYKENEFDVKVINVIKKKYFTEYEVIFTKEKNQFEILSISDKIRDNFEIDGVRILGSNKKNNIIYVQIPLKYEKALI